MRALPRPTAPLVALVLAAASAHAIIETPDPIELSFGIAGAQVRDNALTIDVTNPGSAQVVVDVTGYYNDGSKGHEAVTTTTLKAGETRTVVLQFSSVTGPMPVGTITDDINPISGAAAQTIALAGFPGN
jgi:hypothetical protein